MKKVLLGVLGLIVVAAIVGFFLPTDYAIEREVTIQATPEKVHALVGDLKRWPEWTPWEEEDPTIETTYGEKTTGVGASQSWTGKDGDGELTLTASDAAQGITYDMAFIVDGERVPAKCAMKYTAKGDTTVVTWTMEGDIAGMMPPVVSGYVGLFMPGQISSMFDRGLENLKTKVEAGS